MPCEPDGGMNNCTTVRCPCPPSCEGTLQADGRNKKDTLTFLVCDTCGCCHIAYDICDGGSQERESPVMTSVSDPVQRMLEVKGLKLPKG